MVKLVVCTNKSILIHSILTLVLILNFFHCSIQDDVLAKEEAKATAMRQRFEERTKRFLDAKQRTIGVDKEYLQQQVDEKRLEAEKQKENEKNEGKEWWLL